MPKKLSPQAAIEFDQNSRMLLAVIQYDIEYGEPFGLRTDEIMAHYQGLLEVARSAITKGQSGKVKQWLRDLTEEREHEIRLSQFVYAQTGLELNIRERLLARIQRTVERGRITSDNQYYDVMNEIDFQCQATKPDRQRIKLLNKLVSAYAKRIDKKQSDPHPRPKGDLDRT